MKKTFLSLILPIALLASCGNQPSEAEVAAKNFQDAENLTIKVNSEVCGTFFDETVSVDCLHSLKSPIDLRLSKTAMDASIQMIAGSTYKLSDLLKALKCTIAQLKAIAPDIKVDESKDTATIERAMFPENHSLAGYSEKDQQWIGYSQSETSVHARYVLNRELETLFPKEDIFATVVDTLTKGKFDEEKEGYYFAFGEDVRPTFAAYTGALVTVENGYPVSLEAFADIEKMNASGSAFLLGCPIENATSLYEFSKYNETTITLPNATPTVCEKHNPVTAYDMTKDGHARYCTVCNKYLAVEAHHDHNEYGICSVCGHTETELIFGDKLFYNEENEPVYAYAYFKTSTGVKSHPILACDKNLNELSNCVEGLVDPDTSLDVTYRYYPDVDVLYVLDESQEAKTIESGHCYHAQEIEVKCYLDVGLSVGEEERLIAPEGKSLKDYLGGLTPKCQERFTILDLEHDIETTEAPGEGCDVIYTETCHDCGEVTHQYTEKRHTYAFTKMLVSEFKSALLEEGCDQDIVDDMGALTDEYFVFGKLTCSKGDSTLFVILSKEDLDARESSDETIASIYLTEDDDAWVQELGFFAFPDIPLANSTGE